MAKRIVWGLYDTNYETLVCLFEAENLLVGYRDQLYRKWYEELTAPIPDDDLPVSSDEQDQIDLARKIRTELLNLGRERWTIDQENADYPRWITKKYELWNSTPPNVERMTIHFD